MELKVLTPGRRLVVMQTCDLAMSRSLLPDWYVEAADGVMVPKCDKADYEAGRRVPREIVKQ